MKVVLLRHATRESQDFGDSPLSIGGQGQAQELVERARALAQLPSPTALRPSPKRRARETLAPLSNATGLALDVDPRLDERHQNESAKEFEERVREVIRELDESDSSDGACVYLCTHLDWLEMAMALIASDLREPESSLPWSTAEYRIFEVERGLWKFRARDVARGSTVGVNGGKR